MSTRKKANINPIAMLVGKQKCGQEDADAILLPCMIWLDAAKRGECNPAGCNHITTHVICMTYIASRTKSKAFHEAASHAFDMLRKAAQRPGYLLSLTTPEYQALRKAFSWYCRSLPQVELCVMTAGYAMAQKMMEEADAA